MATVIRPELSTKNKYWIEKHRHYELKHFCLQYPSWRRLYSEIGYVSSSTYGDAIKTNDISDLTPKIAEKRLRYFNRISVVEKVAIETDRELASYILKAVTEDLSYNQLKTKLDIPCSRDTYYDRYRKFFWLLDKERD